MVNNMKKSSSFRISLVVAVFLMLSHFTFATDFSKVVGESLANATVRVVPLSQEMAFLNSYLRLEQMRFPEKFRYEIKTSREINPELIRIPPMLVQPFAENSIRHGFRGKETGGFLVIGFEEAGRDRLKCTISDNGTGRDKSGKYTSGQKENDRLHSAAITETRIRLFNTPEEPDKYHIVYTDLFDDGSPCGLKVELYIPVEKAGD